jgi:signal transduction histidine kinase
MRDPFAPEQGRSRRDPAIAARDPASDDGDRLAVNSGRDILVVDDNQANLIAIEAALAPLGRELVMARSGVEALGRLLEKDFALILLDVAMPGMDGFETARLIRSRERNRATPIIFVTGVSWHDDHVLRGYELGAFDFLVKPIRPEVLRAKAQVFVDLQERTLELSEKAAALREAQLRDHERELAMQRRRLEAEALERQMRHMAEADRRKDEFLAILAHELRNPLQPIQTALELIERAPDEPMSPRVREILHRQVYHLTRLVDDLLDTARFAAGKLQLHRQSLSLAAIVDEAVAASRPLIDARTHVLAVHGTAGSPTIIGDPVRLVQVITNLLNNAAKYTPPAGRIDLTWGVGDGRAFIRVADNGRGISAEVLDRIFDMFVQERAGSDGAGGLGLGLGLVKRLVELHHGSVHASSPGQGQGATFEIRLPIPGKPGAGADGADGPDACRAARLPRSLKAVVVDDQTDLRELVADLLRARGHDVRTVEDGPSAVALICAERPDVALIDIGLPGMDGYDVARTVRRELADHKIRLIAMTGYGQQSDRDRAHEAGFDVHIVKPASAAKILRALHDDPDPS